jgi:hypothetical protein
MRLFNSQRRLLLLANKTRQYLAYATGEIVLITIGILLALQLNNWNKDNENNKNELALLKKLHVEFVSNQKDLDSSIERVEIVITKMTKFLTLMAPEPNPVEDSLIHDYVATYYWNPGYSPNKVVFDTSLSSSEINLIRNTELQNKLREWAALLKNNNLLGESIVSHQFSLSNAWSGLHSWKSSIALTGEMEGIGPSNFPFDQKKFLSLPALEHGVSMKLILVNMRKKLLKTISVHQQEIITLLEKETASL